MKNTKKCENNLNFGASVNFQCLQINSDLRTWQKRVSTLKREVYFIGEIWQTLAYFANSARSLYELLQRVCETAKKLV
jgi:hypothetical protein